MVMVRAYTARTSVGLMQGKSPGSGPRQSRGFVTLFERASLRQVLLDFGLAEELTPRVRKHFLSFLHAIGAGDGVAGARHMLAFGATQVCTFRHRTEC